MIKIDEITEIEIKDGILTISQFDNNEVILTQDNLKKLLKAINYTRCCETLPTKEEMVTKWYNKVFKNDFKFRKVFKDIVDDAYYSGALDMHKELTK